MTPAERDALKGLVEKLEASRDTNWRKSDRLNEAGFTAAGRYWIGYGDAEATMASDLSALLASLGEQIEHGLLGSELGDGSTPRRED